MTNRQLTHIIKDQQPLVASVEDTVRKACRNMLDRGAGSVLAVDEHGCLKGIFTGRDAVRLLAKGGDVADLTLARAMTRDPVTVNCYRRIEGDGSGWLPPRAGFEGRARVRMYLAR